MGASPNETTSARESRFPPISLLATHLDICPSTPSATAAIRISMGAIYVNSFKSNSMAPVPHRAFNNVTKSASFNDWIIYFTSFDFIFAIMDFPAYSLLPFWQAISKLSGMVTSTLDPNRIMPNLCPFARLSPSFT